MGESMMIVLVLLVTTVVLLSLWYGRRMGRAEAKSVGCVVDWRCLKCGRWQSFPNGYKCTECSGTCNSRVRNRLAEKYESQLNATRFVIDLTGTDLTLKKLFWAYDLQLRDDKLRENTRSEIRRKMYELAGQQGLPDYNQVVKRVVPGFTEPLDVHVIDVCPNHISNRMGEIVSMWFTIRGVIKDGGYARDTNHTYTHWDVMVDSETGLLGKERGVPSVNVD